MVADAFGAGALDDAPAVHPDAPVSDASGLDCHRGAGPHSGCEFTAGVADDRVRTFYVRQALKACPLHGHTSGDDRHLRSSDVVGRVGLEPTTGGL